MSVASLALDGRRPVAGAVRVVARASARRQSRGCAVGRHFEPLGPQQLAFTLEVAAEAAKAPGRGDDAVAGDRGIVALRMTLPTARAAPGAPASAAMSP